MKLFCAYGQKEHPKFLDQFISDLKQNHEVLFDSEILGNSYSSLRIKRGIEDCDAFIMLNASESVSSKSFCHVEFSQLERIPIPKLVVFITLDNSPVFSSKISRNHIIDFDDMLNGSYDLMDENKYDSRFTELLDLLSQSKTGEIEQKHHNYKFETSLDYAPLKNALKKACKNTISRYYGISGIDSAFLCDLSFKNHIDGFCDSYRTIEDLIVDYKRISKEKAHNQDIRLLLSGDVHSGRRTQLLYFWQESLKTVKRFVFYISSYDLSRHDPFAFIMDNYLTHIPELSEMEPRDAFRAFKNDLAPDCKATILLEDFDGIYDKDEMDHYFKHEDFLLDNVDVIIRIRYRDSSWPQNYQEIISTGISDCFVEQELRKRGIDPSIVYPKRLIYSLKSPKLLMLLLEDLSNDSLSSIYPGILIQRDIHSRISNAAYSGSIREIELEFAVFGLLPRLAAIQDFKENHILKALPGLAEKAVRCGGIDVDPIWKDLQDHRESSRELFKAYFKRPIVDIMGLMHKPIENGRSSGIYVWNDAAVGNFFLANAILLFYKNEEYDDFINLLNELCNHMLLLDHSLPLSSEKIDPSVFCSYDIARYFLDLATDSELQKMKEMFPRQMASVYCGMALVYELYGRKPEEFDASWEALVVINQLHKTNAADEMFIAHWLSKMAYFAVKSKQNLNEKMRSVTKEALETAMMILENKIEALDLQGLLELSRVYGNTGAYYYNIEEFKKAIQWHRKSLNLKNSLLETTSECHDDIVEGVRRSYVCLAGDNFHLSNYKKSIYYHNKAIKAGATIHSRFQYESYTRKAGSSICYFNEQNTWSLENGEKVLDILIQALNIMGDIINWQELEDNIFEKTKEVLAALESIGIDLNCYKDHNIYIQASKIQRVYNSETWKNDNSLLEFFEKP